jgi:hypothetical protein
MATLFERLNRGRPPSVEQKIKQSHKDPAQQLLDWLQRWRHPTVSSRDICIYGPRPIRDRESAIKSAEVLVRHGWLVPHKTRRQDMKHWQIVRRPIVYPTVAG